MKDVMLDLETLGKRPGCIIRSIGAVLFSRHGYDLIGDGFYINVDRASCEQIGLTADPDTVAWWAKQSAESQAHLEQNPVHIALALASFIGWFKSRGGENVWCQGLTFDVPIITAAMEKLGMKEPWKYYAVRDTRTLYDFCNFDPRNEPRYGTYHNAYDDCIHQVRSVQRAILGASQ